MESTRLPRSVGHWFKLCSLLLVGCLLSPCLGCQGGPSAIQQARSAYYSGDFPAARQHLVDVVDRDRRFGDVAKLDLAIVELASGNPASADSILRDCRKTFDRRDPVEIVPGVRTILTDDRDQPYDAAGYEDVMIRSLLSISSLLCNSGDAEAYAMQAQMRQSELAQQAEERGIGNLGEVYQPLALAPYIRGMLREATHHDYDDAQRAYQLVAQWQPGFHAIEADVIRATEGTHSRPGHGVVYVFALVGRGPVRVEDRAEATGTALLIADRIVAATTNETIPPTMAPIPVPAVVVPPSPTAAIAVSVDGQNMGVTESLTDVAALASRQVQAEMPWVIARGIVRRTAKKAVVASSLNFMNSDNSALHTGGALLGSLWEASERADIRCWSLLPREIQVLRLELPSGEHSIVTSAVGRGTISNASRANVVVRDGVNSYLLVIAPDDRVSALCVGSSF